ncbi:MAG: transcriptional repressor NrdR, partial [Parvularculaceae bacterium]|nr:transcriptional repressor NrdR [Parvularculaceae bacterium]
MRTAGSSESAHADRALSDLRFLTGTKERPMRCPFCGCEDTQVKDSRSAEDGSSIRRRRQCAACSGRFTTFERVQLRELVVVKSSGRKEVFDRDKLMRSVQISL